MSSLSSRLALAAGGGGDGLLGRVLPARLLKELEDEEEEEEGVGLPCARRGEIPLLLEGTGSP